MKGQGSGHQVLSASCTNAANISVGKAVSRPLLTK